jgi:hypothetical protein
MREMEYVIGITLWVIAIPFIVVAVAGYLLISTIVKLIKREI